MAIRNKNFLYKVYSTASVQWDVADWDIDNWDNNSGLVATWDDEVIGEPNTRSAIGIGDSELRIKLARSYNDFGENEDVALYNRVELWVYDIDSPNGTRMFNGRITAYAPVLDGKEEYVEVTVLGLAYELEDYILRDAEGNTTLAYNSVDPSSILIDVIQKYQADGGAITVNGNSVDLTGTTVTYVFSLVTIREAIDKIIELAPNDWFAYVDSTGTIQFHHSNTATPTHKIAVGREIQTLETRKSLESVVNRIYFVGGTPAGENQLYSITSRSSSVDTWGLKAKKVIDGRVTLDATASTMAGGKLDRFDAPITRSVITILDNNGDTGGLGDDIESYKVGETVQIQNLTYGSVTETEWDVSEWDVDVWDQPIQLSNAEVLQITSIDYHLDKVVIEAADRLPEVAKRIEDINRNLEKEVTKDIPIIPS